MASFDVVEPYKGYIARDADSRLEQGRRGAALSVVRRARRALDELAVPLPARLLTLEESIVA